MDLVEAREERGWSCREAARRATEILCDSGIDRVVYGNTVRRLEEGLVDTMATSFPVVIALFELYSPDVSMSDLGYDGRVEIRIPTRRPRRRR